MEPSLTTGSLLLVNRMAYARSLPCRGNIVITNPYSDNIPGPTVKRIIGLPGEDISLNDGGLYIRGIEAVEPYLKGLPSSVGLINKSWNLKSDEYFIIGDNRSNSIDSRNYGPVKLNQIIAKALFCFWPVWLWGTIK